MHNVPESLTGKIIPVFFNANFSWNYCQTACLEHWVKHLPDLSILSNFIGMKGDFKL